MKVSYENCKRCRYSEKPSGKTDAKIKCSFKQYEIRTTKEPTRGNNKSWDCKMFKKRKKEKNKCEVEENE